MTEAIDTAPAEPTYIATFSLRQEGKDGPVYSELTFDPEKKFEGDELPVSYAMMMELAMLYLFWAGEVDEDGAFLDEKGFTASASVQHLN